MNRMSVPKDTNIEVYLVNRSFDLSWYLIKLREKYKNQLSCHIQTSNSWWGVGLRRGCSGAETKGYRISRMSAKPLGKVRNGFSSSANVWLYVSPVMSTGIDPIETSRLTSLSVNKQFEECMVGVWFACTDLRTFGLSPTEWINMDQLPLKPGASERNLAQLSIMGNPTVVIRVQGLLII